MNCRSTFLVLALTFAASCGDSKRAEWENTFTGKGEDAFVDDAAFACFRNNDKVAGAYYRNVNGHTGEMLRVAKEGGVFPVGTIVALSTIEAMVKRGKGFSEATGDWEYFKLDTVDGKRVITHRGKEEVRNIVGGCEKCHVGVEAKWDRVCGHDRGCKPLPGFVVKAGMKQIERDSTCE